MGPSKEYSYFMGEKYTQEVLELLRKKGIYGPSQFATKEEIRQWNSLVDQLMATIQEMNWLDDAMYF
jgi:hypothetical protein